jgi:hypothetical protein
LSSAPFFDFAAHSRTIRRIVKMSARTVFAVVAPVHPRLAARLLRPSTGNAGAGRSNRIGT